MKSLFLALMAAVLLTCPALAQNHNVRIVGRASDGVDRPVLVTTDGKLQVDTSSASATATPQNVTERGGSTIATGQVVVGTTATLVAAARTGRQKIGVTVTTAVQCAFGNAGVTLATGWPLVAAAYTSDSWDTSAAIYGVCASADTTVAYREQY